MTVVCHLWPSVSPWNIWDLPIGVWFGFAAEADQYVADIKKEREGK
jgi:hypothetical protein